VLHDLVLPLTAPPSADGLARVASAIGVDGPLRVMRRLRGGLGAATHLLAADEDRFVLKRYPRHKAATVEAESAALSPASCTELPVPTLVATDSVGNWFARPALVMSRVPGHAEQVAKRFAAIAERILQSL
jgi:aminoglycoside phosphotransferase